MIFSIPELPKLKDRSGLEKTNKPLYDWSVFFSDVNNGATMERTSHPQAIKDLLIRMLERKFGPLSSEYQTQLDSASPVQLEAYFDAALTAASIKKVFDR